MCKLNLSMLEKEKAEKTAVELEADLIRQEHRFFAVVKNYVSRKKIWNEPNDPRRGAARFAFWMHIFFSRSTIVIVTGGFVGIMTVYLMHKQNDLFEAQNNLFELQNKRIDQQTNLEEASRRSTQMFVMSEVLSDVNKELIDPKNKSDTLSNTLAGRIISLSTAMKPYKYLENDSLIVKPLSPERGQLLISLVESKINEEFFTRRILKNANFSYADLSRAVLNGANFKDLELIGVNFEKAKLENTQFQKATLTSANFRNSKLIRANFSQADLEGADFRRAFLTKAVLDNANLTKAIFDSVNFNGASLVDAKLEGAMFRGTYFRNANLNTRFKGVNLRGADLSGAKIENANFVGAQLEGVIVSRPDWINYVSHELQVEGGKIIERVYRLDTIRHAEFGNSYILVRKENQP